jgi:hypothetical protein
MSLFVTLLFLRGPDMILARLWIVRHEFTIFEFGAFDRGQTCDATHRRFDCDIKLGQNDPLFLLPMNASSFLDSHFLFHKNKPDLTISLSCFLKL